MTTDNEKKDYKAITNQFEVQNFKVLWRHSRMSSPLKASKDVGGDPTYTSVPQEKSLETSSAIWRIRWLVWRTDIKIYQLIHQQILHKASLLEDDQWGLQQCKPVTRNFVQSLLTILLIRIQAVFGQMNQTLSSLGRRFFV